MSHMRFEDGRYMSIKDSFIEVCVTRVGDLDEMQYDMLVAMIYKQFIV